MRHIIFDFDGTLADSLPLVIEIAEELLGPLNLSESEKTRLRNLPMRAVLKESGIAYSKILRLVVKGRAMIKQRMDELNIIPDLGKEIKAIKSDGYMLYVLSSNSEGNIRSFLKRNDLLDCFSDVKGSIGLFSKTSALKKFLKVKKIDKNDCLYVGDEVRDVDASKKLGIPIISVAWGFNGEKILKASDPDVLIQKPSDLLGAIEKVGKR